jgi:hypothetical protein
MDGNGSRRTQNLIIIVFYSVLIAFLSSLFPNLVNTATKGEHVRGYIAHPKSTDFWVGASAEKMMCGHWL